MTGTDPVGRMVDLLRDERDEQAAEIDRLRKVIRLARNGLDDGLPADVVADILDQVDRTDQYRIAVRPHHKTDQWADDIVVNDVDMFRMEQMDRRVWWACCYLRGEDPGNRIGFDIRWVPKEREVVVTVTEWPIGVVYEHEIKASGELAHEVDE